MTKQCFNVSEKDFLVLSHIVSFVSENSKNNIISFSLNQITTYLKNGFGLIMSPKSVQRCVKILEAADFVKLIAKPLKSKKKFCIGKAKSIYAVTDFTYNEIKFNADFNAYCLRKIDVKDKQIIGKLDFIQFFSYFKFNFSVCPYLYSFVKKFTLYLYNNYILYSNYIYIVYPGFFLESIRNLYNFYKHLLEKYKDDEKSLNLILSWR